MTREEAQRWFQETLDVSRETLGQLEQLEQSTIDGNTRQNLIARSTIEDFWRRHLIDSAQLLLFTKREPALWLDLGSGAGFPGLVIALLSKYQVILSEERHKRADHLEAMIAQLELFNASVLRGRIEMQKAAPFGVISARAFAPLERLFALAHHLSSPETLWLLPKGKSAASELEVARITWQGDFRIEPSVTDPDGAIIVATGIQPRRRR